MPTIILSANSADEINDVLSVRHKLLQNFDYPIDPMFQKGGRVVDPLDLYPDTVNLLAYRDGTPIATARFLVYRTGDPLLHSIHDFDDSAKQVEAPIYFMDWLGILPGSGDSQRLLNTLLEYGILLLARRQAKSLLGCLPSSLLGKNQSELLTEFEATQLGPKKNIGGKNWAIPVVLDLQRFYMNWVAGIKDREILRFQDLFYISLFEPGEVLFVQGERGSTAYLLQEGQVEIVLQKGDSIIPLATLDDSQLVGEIAMITQEVRTASLVAKTAVSCITLDRQAFLETLDRAPHLAMDIFKIFSKRISEANRRIAGADAPRPGP